jgi:hypothetical protein
MPLYGIGEGIQGFNSGLTTGMLLFGRAGNYGSLQEQREDAERLKLANLGTRAQLDYLRTKLAAGAPLTDDLITQLGVSINRATNERTLAELFNKWWNNAKTPMDQEAVLQQYLQLSHALGNINDKDLASAIAQSQNRALEQAKYLQEKATRDAERDVYAGILAGLEGAAGRKSLLEPMIETLQKKYGLTFNDDVVKAFLGLNEKDQRRILQYISEFTENGPRTVADILSNPDPTNALNAMSAILNAGLSTEKEQPSVKEQSPTEVPDEINAEIKRISTERERALRLLAINPSNVEARQALTAATNRLAELSGQAAAYGEAFPQGSEKEPLHYDPQYSPSGFPWSPKAKRVIGLMQHLKTVEDAYARLVVSRNPYAQPVLDRFRQSIEQARASINQLSQMDKITPYEKRAITELYGTTYNPDDPVHIAHILDNQALMKAVRAKATEIERTDAAKKAGEIERVQSEYRDNDMQMVARATTGHAIGPGTTPEEAQTILKEKQKLDVERQAAQGKAAAEIQAVKPLPAEQAGKLGKLMSGFDSLKDVWTGLVKKDGTIDRQMLTQMNLNAPGTRGRKLRRAITEAIWAQIRPETGAAMSIKEEEGLWDQYGPNILDPDEVVIDKLNAIARTIANEISLMDPTGAHRKMIQEGQAKMMEPFDVGRQAFENARRKLKGKK